MKKSLTILFCLIGFFLQAQDNEIESKNDFNLGLGIGMDYGGAGIKGTFQPIKKLGFFAGVGYNLDGIGFNTGAQLLLPKKRHAFYFTGMYGYNGVLIVTGELEGKGTYYGFSLGVGYQLKVGRNKNFWNWEIIVPFRNRNFYNDYDTLNNLRQNPGDILPVTLSVGYHIQIRPQ